MNNTVRFASLGLSLATISALTACGTPASDAQPASSSTSSLYAIVKDCKGVMNEDWLDVETLEPVKGELKVNGANLSELSFMPRFS